MFSISPAELMPLISTAIYASDVCVCGYVCGFQTVICSILFFTFHLYGIFRSVAPHLSLSHLTHSSGMSVCVCLCVCARVWLCMCLSVVRYMPVYIRVCRSGYLCHSLSSPLLSVCVVSGEIVG